MQDHWHRFSANVSAASPQLTLTERLPIWVYRGKRRKAFFREYRPPLVKKRGQKILRCLELGPIF